MEEKTKKGLIIGGSVAAVVILAGGITLGVVLGGANKAKNTISANDYGIAAFANLESFDNDGFNNGVKKAAENYIGYYNGESSFSKDDSYFNFKDKKTVEKYVSHYSDDGREYVPMLTDHFSSNDIIISAGFQVGGAITGQLAVDETNPGFNGVFTKADGTDTSFANSKDKAFVLMDDEGLASTYENTASVSFAAEGSGYASAAVAYAYTFYDAVTNHKTETGYTPNIVMWGGKSFPTVYDYMSGFAQGISDLNGIYADSFKNINSEWTKGVTLWSGGSNESKDNEISAENSYGTSTNTDTWYTDGFDAVTGTTDGDLADVKTTNAVNANASVVFPIAGGNTTVAEANLVKNGSTTKLLGVDADATLASTADDLYIASAEKNLALGGSIALWAMDDYDNDGVRNIDEDDVNANDQVGQYLTTPQDGAAKSLLEQWQVDKSTAGTDFKGTGLRGTADNGGAGVIVGSEQQDGTELTLFKADGKTNLTQEELIKWVKDFLASGSSKGIENADRQFVPGS